MEGKDVISQFYTYYNDSNIDGVMSLMAEDCKYHDMIYSDPFEGHEEIRAYFEKVTQRVCAKRNIPGKQSLSLKVVSRLLKLPVSSSALSS